MLKKVTVLLLAFIMVFSFSGCKVVYQKGKDSSNLAPGGNQEIILVTQSPDDTPTQTVYEDDIVSSRTPEPTAKVLGKKMYITGNDVRVRTAPSTEASYFTHLSKGASVNAYEETNGFYRVVLSDGTEAYIMAKYLSTAPATPDPTPVPVNVKVVDALNYKKPIVQYIEDETGIHIDPNPAETKYHVIIVPRITDDSDAAKAINTKMYGNIQGIYNSLLNNREDTEIYGADYAYTNYNGIIGISQKKHMGGQFQGGTDAFYFYYYDSVNKKELTFDEYLSLLGISRSNFSKLKKDDGTPIYEEWLPNITNGIFDTNGGQFYVLFPDSPDGGMAFETSTNLFQ